MTTTEPRSTYLRTEDVPLAQLTPFPGNAKRGRVDIIRQSLKEHGQFRALVVRLTPADTLVVLAGNHTMLALAEHGPGQCADGKRDGSCSLCAGGRWKESARCEIITCDDATATKINLVDNKSSDDGEYDKQALALLISGLEGDYEGTGFADDEVADLLEALESEEQPDPEELVYREPEVSWNDTPEDMERRIRSHGGHDGTTMASRGVRDIILALPSAQADELGQMVMELREELGALSQGDVLLAAARVAVAVFQREAIEQGAADCPFDPEQPWRPGDAAPAGESGRT